MTIPDGTVRQRIDIPRPGSESGAESFFRYSFLSIIIIAFKCKIYSVE